MFKHVDAYAGDPILSLMETFKADPRADKVNLSIGLYYDEAGVVPQLAAVDAVEKRIPVRTTKPPCTCRWKSAPTFRAPEPPTVCTVATRPPVTAG